MPESDDDVDEAYADVTAAMESAFVRARARRPDLTVAELFVALLLLKDRLLEQYIPIDGLPEELADLAKQLYGI